MNDMQLTTGSTSIGRTCHRASLRTAVSALIAAVLASPALAFASEDAGFTFKIHGFYLIDFAVFVGIIVYFGRKPIAAALDQRYKNVATDIEEARELHEQAKAKYDEYALRLDRLEDELAKVIDEVRAGTEKERTRILGDAEREVDRIKSDARARLSQETKKIRQELATHAANFALELAQAQIHERLAQPGAQLALIDRSLSELDERGVIAAHEVTR